MSAPLALGRLEGDAPVRAYGIPVLTEQCPWTLNDAVRESRLRKEMVVFKTEASKVESGNWNLKASCSKGHAVFKDQMHASSDYKCPYCGEDVY